MDAGQEILPAPIGLGYSAVSEDPGPLCLRLTPSLNAQPYRIRIVIWIYSAKVAIKIKAIATVKREYFRGTKCAKFNTKEAYLIGQDVKVNYFKILWSS